MTRRAAAIGAGSSGLAQPRAFHSPPLRGLPCHCSTLTDEAGEPAPRIRFRMPVHVVTRGDATGKPAVAAHDLKCGRTYTNEFDHVVVASGQFSTPNVPAFAGFDRLNGGIPHAH